MIRTDIHTHTKFSADGRNSIEEMIAAAMQKGLAWYGISEHFNYDYDRLHLTIDGQEGIVLCIGDTVEVQGDKILRVLLEKRGGNNAEKKS